jgi:hypothetical protein
MAVEPRYQRSSVSEGQGTDWSTQRMRRGRAASYSELHGAWLPGVVLIGLGAMILAEKYFSSTLWN